MITFHLNGYQAAALARVLRKHNDGENVFFTLRTRDGSLVVAFDAATVTIDEKGDIEQH